MQEYEYIDREPVEADEEVVEISDDTLTKIGGGVVGIWF
jgi:hypothetical protein